MTVAQAVAQPGTANVGVGYATSQGKVRESNQDNAAVFGIADAPLGDCILAVVADGMGGHQGGEIASTICVDSIRECVQAASSSITSWSVARRVLRESLQLAHSRIRQYAAANGSNLGTTATAALYSGGEVEIAHVGDSRAYLVSGGEVRQLTDDDSWVAEQVRQGTMTQAEAASSANRNVLTQALSVSPDVLMHSYHERVPQQTCFLLCSDGLHGVVKPAALRQIVVKASGPRAAAEKLVDSANSLGGPDNITVVCLFVGGGPRSKNPTAPVLIDRPLSGSRIKRLLAATAAVSVALAIGLSGWNYLRHSGCTLPPDAPEVRCVIRLEGKTAEVQCDKGITCRVYFRGARCDIPVAGSSRVLGDRITYSASTRINSLADKPVRLDLALRAARGSAVKSDCVVTTETIANGYSVTVHDIVGAPRAKIVLLWVTDSDRLPQEAGTDSQDNNQTDSMSNANGISRAVKRANSKQATDKPVSRTTKTGHSKTTAPGSVKKATDKKTNTQVRGKGEPSEPSVTAPEIPVPSTMPTEGSEKQEALPADGRAAAGANGGTDTPRDVNGAAGLDAPDLSTNPKPEAGN